MKEVILFFLIGLIIGGILVYKYKEQVDSIVSFLKGMVKK